MDRLLVEQDEPARVVQAVVQAVRGNADRTRGRALQGDRLRELQGLRHALEVDRHLVFFVDGGDLRARDGVDIAHVEIGDWSASAISLFSRIGRHRRSTCPRRQIPSASGASSRPPSSPRAFFAAEDSLPDSSVSFGKLDRHLRRRVRLDRPEQQVRGQPDRIRRAAEVADHGIGFPGRALRCRDSWSRRSTVCPPSFSAFTRCWLLPRFSMRA